MVTYKTYKPYLEMQTHPLIPASYSGQSNSWGFVGLQSLEEEKGGEGNWAGPPPLFISGFSLIGMALACAGPDNDEDATG